MSNKDDYEVGYKKPPSHTRFKAGQSGNPKGRKKGCISVEAATFSELNSKVKIREGDQEYSVTKLAALIKSRINAALKGDRHAFADVMRLLDRLEVDLQKATEVVDLSAQDAQILALFKKQGEVNDDV